MSRRHTSTAPVCTKHMKDHKPPLFPFYSYLPLSSPKTKMETKPSVKRSLLALNCLIFAIGICASPLIMRLYYIHGGTRIWLASWLETGGWPLILIPLAIAYRRRRAASPRAPLFFMTRPVFVAATAVGVLTGIDDYMYAYGAAKAPAMQSALIMASQLAYTAGFRALLVGQRFTPYTVNALVLLTVGPGVLAMHASGDKKEGESGKEYAAGVVIFLAAAVLYGFVLPLVEWTYKRARKEEKEVGYTLVLEFQVVMCFFATLVCTGGMLVNNDFKAIPGEAREFGLGETKYYVVLVWSAIIWQCFFLGVVGVIFCASSLVSAIEIAVLLPATEVLAIIVYQESFQAENGLSLGLCLWGLASYLYGEMKERKRQSPSPETQTRAQSQMGTSD